MKRTKVLLLRANLPHVHQSLGIPLGVLYLTSALRAKLPGRCEIRVLDPGKQQLSVEDVGKTIADWQPDVVGISGMTPEAPAMHEIAAAARAHAPRAAVLVGGPHAFADHDELLADRNIDYVCLGEGEETFPEMIEALGSGASMERVAGVAMRLPDGTIRKTRPRPAIQDLDALPYPAWDMLDVASYSDVRNMNGGLLAAKPYMALFTSRGCPYRCEYCHEVFGKTIRFRSPESVVGEMEHLHRELGIREFHIYDDIFNLDKRRTQRICDRILERGLKIRMAFPNALRGDILDRETIRKLAAAGAYSTSLAIETASPRLQKLIRKNLKLEKVAESIGGFVDEGVITTGFFMLGFPTETADEMRQTVEFALESRLHRAAFFGVVPFPGSGLEALVREYYPDYRYDRQFGYFSTNTFYKWATGVDLGVIQRDAYRRFYWNPRRLWSLWQAYPSAWSFVREASTAAYCMLPGLQAKRDRTAPAAVPAFLRRGT